MIESALGALPEIPRLYPYEIGKKDLPDLLVAPQMPNIDGPRSPFKPIAPHICQKDWPLAGLPDLDWDPSMEELMIVNERPRGDEMPAINLSKQTVNTEDLSDPTTVDISQAITQENIFYAVWPLFARLENAEEIMQELQHASSIVTIVRKYFPTWQDLNEWFVLIKNAKAKSQYLIGTLPKWQERLQRALPSIYQQNPLRG